MSKKDYYREFYKTVHKDLFLTKKQFRIRQFLSLILITLALYFFGLAMEETQTHAIIFKLFLFYSFGKGAGMLVEYNFGWNMYIDEKLEELYDEKKHIEKLLKI